MPVFPAINERTICEKNRNLLISRGEGDNASKDEYSKILGVVYPDIVVGKGPLPDAGLECTPIVQVMGEYARGPPQQGDEAVGEGTEAEEIIIPNLAPPEDVAAEIVPELVSKIVKRAVSLSVVLAGRITSQLQSGKDVQLKLSRRGPLSLVSWHKHRQRLAVLGYYDRVLLYDLEAKDPSASAAAAVLVHEFQRDASVMEWRPQSGATLAVGCRNGVCVWSLNSPVSIAPPVPSTPTRGMRVTAAAVPKYRLANASMVFLKSPGFEPVTSLSWSPCGRLLATASSQSGSVMIWDAALGVGTLMRRGLTGVALLKWSPTGDYLVSAKVGGEFHLWETNTWRSEQWSSGSGRVVSCDWSPDGKIVLLAFENSATLGAIHFAGRPPSLDAHLLPIDLPEITTLAGTNAAGACIELMAWDSSGERLAVSYSGGDATTKGLIAVYDTRRTPILAASLVGCIRGPSEDSRALSLSFHNRFSRGALLAVGWSDGYCCIYPMLFRGL